MTGKKIDADNEGCNDNYDDNYDKNDYKTYNYCEVYVKKCYFKDYYLVKKKGQKIRAWVDPPFFRQRPKENVFFLLTSSLTMVIL